MKKGDYANFGVAVMVTLPLESMPLAGSQISIGHVVNQDLDRSRRCRGKKCAANASTTYHAALQPAPEAALGLPNGFKPSGRM